MIAVPSLTMPAWSCRSPLQRFGSHAAAQQRAAAGGRDFYNRLNYQHLAHQLESLSVPGHEAANEGALGQKLFDPKVRMRPVRSYLPARPHGKSAEEAEELRRGSPSTADAGPDFKFGSRRPKPWLHYESLRGEAYPGGHKSTSSSNAKGPRWQDLTHSEAQRLQEMYMRKRMLNRKMLWLKMQDLPNPHKEAKMTVRREKKLALQEQNASNMGQLYPPPFMDAHPGSGWLTREEENARRDELESRFRNRIRQQKLENARIVKQPAPMVGDFITDPIQRHVNRRLIRQRAKIHMGLEEFLYRNSAQILYEHLGGAQVSIVKIKARKPRSTQLVHYSLLSDHDPEWVQKQLDTLTPKLRSQFALKVNMGMTPRMRFVPFTREQDVRRKYIWGFARRLQRHVAPGAGYESTAAAAAAARAKQGPGANGALSFR